jgi:exonuclease III
MTGITTYLSILTLNVNGLNSTIKRHHLAKWIKKENPKICGLHETHLIDRSKHNLNVKGPGVPKTGKCNNTYLGQSRLQTYVDQITKETP